jgi:uncharacterized protein YmfQ (DUF2313 family)
MYQVSNNSTQHGLKTPHGFRTPHRFPVKSGTKEELMALANQLYPTGRVWNLSEQSKFNALHAAINLSILRLTADAYSLIDGSFPDNNNFTVDDATLWEYRLGLLAGTLTLEQRKANILRKMAFPQNVKARQSVPYIESQLQQSGFNVRLYENIFYDVDGNLYRKEPADILSLQTGTVQHGGSTQHGAGAQHGGGNTEVVANEAFEENYNIGGADNLYATFFIAGNQLSEIATVEKSREREFRELILKLKPAHTVAFLFVNYI